MLDMEAQMVVVLEMVLLTAEILELKANKNRKARGVVIEALLDIKKKGEEKRYGKH